MTFIERVGSSIASPQLVFRHVADGGRGGLRDALALLALAVLSFELVKIVRAGWTVVSLDMFTGLLLLLQPFSATFSELIAIVIASWIITWAAGRARRDTTRDLSLAALAWIPGFAVRMMLSAAGIERLGWLQVVGWSWMVALVILAIRIVRA